MVTLRIATVGDAPALAAIYTYYVEQTAVTFEYDPPDALEFAARIAHKLEKYPFLVAEEGGAVVGYAYASELRERAAFGWDAELSVYLHPDKRGHGIGERLYRALIELLGLQGFAAVYACITSPNEPSVALHEKLGFSYAGRFTATGYKLSKWHDVLWYEKRIGGEGKPLPLTDFSLLDRSAVEKILQNEVNS